MSDETRKDPRAKIVSLNVRYKSATVDDFIEDHSWDVSRGGIFIKTTTPFAQGTLLKFEIRLADNESAISGVGRVVWRREVPDASLEKPAGMGVKFIKVEDKSKAVIDKLVSQKENAGGGYSDGLLTPPPVHEGNVHLTPAGGIVAAGAGSMRPLSSPPQEGAVTASRTGSIAPRPTGKRTLIGTGSVAPPPSTTPPTGKGSTTPPTGKGTMLGLGAVSVPPPPQALGATATLETRDDAVGGLRSLDLGDSSVAEESTIVRQADELLIEAAGQAGSDAASGLRTTNPLFAPARPGSVPPPPGAHDPSSDVVSSARPPSIRPASPMGGFVPGSEVAGRSLHAAKPSPSTPTEAARESDAFAPLDSIARATETSETFSGVRSSKRGWMYVGALALGAAGAYVAATASRRPSDVPDVASASAKAAAGGPEGSVTGKESTMGLNPPVVAATAAIGTSSVSATAVIPSASSSAAHIAAPHVSASAANSGKPPVPAKVPTVSKPREPIANTPAPPERTIAAPVAAASTSVSPVASVTPVASETPKAVDSPKPTEKPPVAKPATSKPDDSDNPY